jgi:hypothetical protein
MEVNDNQDLLKKLVLAGLSAKKAQETLNNISLTRKLSSAIEILEKHVEETTKKKGKNTLLGFGFPQVGKLILHLCKKIEDISSKNLDILVSLIARHKLNSIHKINFALQFINNQNDAEICETELQKYVTDNMLERLRVEDIEARDLEKMNKNQLIKKFKEMHNRHKNVSKKFILFSYTFNNNFLLFFLFSQLEKVVYLDQERNENLEKEKRDLAENYQEVFLYQFGLKASPDNAAHQVSPEEIAKIIQDSPKTNESYLKFLKKFLNKNIPKFKVPEN